jgi:hypothetical protein
MRLDKPQKSKVLERDEIRFAHSLS